MQLDQSGWNPIPDPTMESSLQRSTRAKCGDLLIGIGEMERLGEKHQSAEEAKAALLQYEILMEAYQW